MLIIKSGKRQIIEGRELPNQEKIRIPREKETYKYLRILKADTIKNVEMKEKIGKDEEKNSKPSSAAGISSKGSKTGLSSC